MQYLHVTLHGHNHRVMVINNIDDANLKDYAVIDVARNQNQLRWMIAVLNNMPVARSGLGRTIYAVEGTYNLRVTYDVLQREYRLWAYAHNGNLSGYYAGMIHAERVRKQRKARNKRKQAA